MRYCKPLQAQTPSLFAKFAQMRLHFNNENPHLTIQLKWQHCLVASRIVGVCFVALFFLCNFTLFSPFNVVVGHSLRREILRKLFDVSINVCFVL